MSSAQTPVKLPIARRNRDRSGCGTLAKSRTGKWRAAVLIAIHVLIALHIWHWLAKDTTISPVEPSETMYSLQSGVINAGAVLFGSAILATAIFGRFFCGWACHLVALQDLCTWILRKLGFRPKPFRSRLLLFVPLLAALYMFVWPVVVHLIQWWRGVPPPAVEIDFQTREFWKTFPGISIAILTFATCGFLIVYLLGNKGFCTYACPYGGFFGPIDTVSPGRIRVTDACEGCGHCTATCTSNVRVHEEVRRFGMVVDPGCMKCMDCISVCPNDALYYGFGRPAVGKGAPRAERIPTAYDFTWREELLTAGFFLASLACLYKLYDAIPFLLALGMSAMVAFVLLMAARCAYVPSLRLHTWQLRLRGRLRPAGAVFLSLAGLLGLFLAHSATIQALTYAGVYYSDRSDRLAQSTGDPRNAEVVAASERSLWLLENAHRFGLVPVIKIEARIGALNQFLGRMDVAERWLSRVVQQEPTFGAARQRYAEVLATRGDYEGGLRELKEAIRHNPDLLDARRDLVMFLSNADRAAEGIPVFEDIVQRRKRDYRARVDLAMLRAQSGDLPRARRELEAVVQARDDMADAHFRLGIVRAEMGDLDGAIASLGRAAQLAPRDAQVQIMRAQLLLQRGRVDDAIAAMDAARAAAPLNPGVVQTWAGVLAQTGRLPERIARSRAAPPADAAGWYALAMLHRVAGDAGAADQALERARSMRPDVPPLP